MKKSLISILAFTFLFPILTTNAGDLPDPFVTPGEVDQNATVEMLCTSGYSKSVRHVTQETKDYVCHIYDVECKGGDYEVDHLVPLSIGGTNSSKNLWPQSYKTCPHNAWIKDRLEKYTRSEVCKTLRTEGHDAATVLLQQFQNEIASNWITAYQKYIVDTGKVKSSKSAERCLTSGVPVE